MARAPRSSAPNRRPDTSQTCARAIRPHPVAGPSPNVPWISIREEKDGTPMADGVDLDGAGHFRFDAAGGRSRGALAAKTSRGIFRSRMAWLGEDGGGLSGAAEDRRSRRPGGADRLPRRRSLRANDALNLSYAELRRSTPAGHRIRRRTSRPAACGSSKAPNDYFDGARSFWGILGLHSLAAGAHQRARDPAASVPKAGESRDSGASSGSTSI